MSESKPPVILPSTHPLAFNPYAFRPARKQRKPLKGSLQTAEVQGDYNIWYHRHYGGDRQDKYKRDDAVNPGHRCNIERDSGYTKGDMETGQHMCLFFARGCCERGSDCSFLHRAPNEFDEVRIGTTVDIFGRERHSTDREDMGGVGNFNRNCRTLYVSGIKQAPGDNPEEILSRHFGEWGEITHINAPSGKTIAFVTYKLRVAAEFAKEAMANQQLDHDEVLNVRWAHEDPNPKNLKPGEQERDHVRAAKALAATNPALQAYARMIPAAPAKRGRDDETIAAYPDTDQQYEGASAPALNDQAQFYSFDPLTNQYVYNFPWAHWAYVTGQTPADLMGMAQEAEPSLEEVLQAQAQALGGVVSDDAPTEFADPDATSTTAAASEEANSTPATKKTRVTDE